MCEGVGERREGALEAREIVREVVTTTCRHLQVKNKVEQHVHLPYLLTTDLAWYSYIPRYQSSW